MKIILVALFILTATLAGRAQKTNNSPHYLFDEFHKGTVLLKGGKTQEAKMNYNVVTEEMIYIHNARMLALDMPGAIDTIFLNERKFIPYEKKFYELVYNGAIPLFVQHKKHLSPAGKPSGYGGTTQTSAVTSIKNLSSTGGIYELKLPEDLLVSDATLFWLRVNDEWHSFVNEKQMMRVFPDKKEEIKNIIRNEDIEIKDPQKLIRLMRFINGEK